MPNESAVAKPLSMQTVVYSPRLDATRRKVTDTPSPESLASWLNAVDEGDVAALCELQEEMEEKWSHLQGVANTRRAAFLGLDWDIQPPERAAENGQAQLAAKYCRERLEDLPTWSDTLAHLATAIGPNVAVVELIWHRGELVKTVEVPGHRLTRDVQNRSGAISIVTDDEPLGVSTRSRPYKFGVYHPRKLAGDCLRRTLTHASIWLYLVSHFSKTDWMAFQELYGTPLRVAKYDGAVTPAVKQKVDDMLKNMSTDVAGHFPDGVSIELLTVSGKGETFEAALQWAQQATAILYLGQTLTTDIGNVGSRAAAEVHERVRADILYADLRAEARFIREQILRPMVRLRFPNLNVPIPHFVRTLTQEPDTAGEQLRMQQFKLALDAGLMIDVDEAYEAVGFTKPVSWPADAMTIGGRTNAVQGSPQEEAQEG